ncbi:hypothetical protein AGMMS50212_05960 [Spirochaetia bacterium]|nr:hypothetical protein AGMMS50212_05960 [Spirochaetia bacterium]
MIGEIMKKVVFMTVVLTAVLGLSGCDRIKSLIKKDAGGTEAVKEIPVIAVGTVKVGIGTIQDYLGLSGDIVSGSSVDVYSDVAGNITRVNVKIGDRVTRGQAVASVDPSQPGMTYRVNVVTAPIAGIVTAVPGQVGQKISQANSIVQIAGGGALEIQLNVSEKNISKIKMGLPCTILLDAYPGESFRGRVSEISPTVDPASRTMKIKVNVDNQGSRLKAGMFATVRVIVQQKDNVLELPSNAILQRGEDKFVYKVDSDPANPSFRAARRVVIEPGLQVDTQTEIVRGLSLGDEIVVKGQTNLSDGARINVINN